MGFKLNGQELQIEVVYKDSIPTEPPQGKYKVKNLWVHPDTGKLEVEYEDTPEE